MAEKTYKFTVMLNDDHSFWKTIPIKAKNENTARKKLEKRLTKIATSYLIDKIEVE